MDARPDPFESVLRTVLHDRAHRAIPAHGLTSMLDEVMAGGRSRGVPRVLRWAGALVAMAASVLVIVALGVLSRPSGSMWSVGGDGDDGPAILWDSGRASLEADSFRIEALGT